MGGGGLDFKVVLNYAASVRLAWGYRRPCLGEREAETEKFPRDAGYNEKR